MGLSCRQDEDVAGLPEEQVWWDHALMSDQHSRDRQDPSLHQHGQSAPSTQPMRTVGQRRRESEEKLGSHLRDARQRNEHHQAAESEGAAGNVGAEEVDAGDVAAIQNDDQLTPADRVDLIANQAIPETGNNEG